MTANCTIPSGTMSYLNSYKIKFTATIPSNSNMTAIKWADIDTKPSEISLFIDGGDRAITVERENVFIANAEPKSNDLIYHWG